MFSVLLILYRGYSSYILKSFPEDISNYILQLINIRLLAIMENFDQE